MGVKMVYIFHTQTQFTSTHVLECPLVNEYFLCRQNLTHTHKMNNEVDKQAKPHIHQSTNYKQACSFPQLVKAQCAEAAAWPVCVGSRGVYSEAPADLMATVLCNKLRH